MKQKKKEQKSTKKTSIPENKPVKRTAMMVLEQVKKIFLKLK